MLVHVEFVVVVVVVVMSLVCCDGNVSFLSKIIAHGVDHVREPKFLRHDYAHDPPNAKF